MDGWMEMCIYVHKFKKEMHSQYNVLPIIVFKKKIKDICIKDKNANF